MKCRYLMFMYHCTQQFLYVQIQSIICRCSSQSKFNIIMTLIQDIDYKSNLFEQFELTMIVGELTMETLITLQAGLCNNI